MENSLIQMHPASENTPECLRWTLDFPPWDQQRTKATIKKCTNSSGEEHTTPERNTQPHLAPPGERRAARGSFGSEQHIPAALCLL